MSVARAGRIRKNIDYNLFHRSALERIEPFRLFVSHICANPR